MKLRPVTYNLDTKSLNNFLHQGQSHVSDSLINSHDSIDFAPSTNIVHSGFIAQEVEQASINCGFTSSIVSAPANSNDPYALNYAEIVVPLVKAVQQLDSLHGVDSLNNASLKQQLDSSNAIQALQQQAISDLQSIVATCCSASGSGGRRGDTTGTGNNSQQHGDGNGTVTLSISDESNTAILGQNIPNPANGSTIIPFRIPQNCNSATIVITETETGKLVNAIPVSCKETNLSIEAGSIATGTYVYSLYIDGKLIDTKKMVLTK